MKNAKYIGVISLAVVIAIMLAISANAKNISLQTMLDDKPEEISVAKFMAVHPKEFAELILDLDRGETSNLSQYFNNPDDLEYFLRMNKIDSTIGALIKTGLVTNDVRNSERFVVPKAQVKSNGVQSMESAASEYWRPGLPYSFLTVNFYTGNKISLDTFLMYKNAKNDLVVWGIIRDDSDTKIELRGISDIELKYNGKTFAAGSPTKFKTPIKLAPYPKEFNLGIYDSLPTECFVKLTFEPGTYDGDIDITNIDNISSAYEMDYSAIQ